MSTNTELQVHGLGDRRPITPAVILLVSIAYYLAAEAAFAIGTLTEMFAPFWPPNVVLLCALLMVPPRQWWVYLIAVFPAHVVAELSVGMPVPQLIVAFACNAAFAVLSAAGLRWFLAGAPWLGSLRNVSIYVLITVIVVPGVVALAGGIEPVLGDGDLGRYWEYSLRWYLSNALGSLTLTPVFLTWVADGRRWQKTAPQHLPEVVALCLGIVAACGLAFGASPQGMEGNLFTAKLYAPIPLVLWAAVRFKGRGATGATLVVAVLALWHVMQGQGPFAGSIPGDNVLSLQVFLATIAASMLVLAAVIEELERTNRRLEGVLAGISDCYYTLDRKWRFTAINSKAAAWFGAEHSGALVGRNYEEVLGPATAATAASSISQALTENARSGIEVVSAVHPDRWIDLQAYPSSEGVSVFFRDVTQRRSVELALGRSMKRLQLAHEAASIGSWEWSIADGELIWSAEQYLLWGVDPQIRRGALYETWLAILHPEDRDWVENETRAALASCRAFAVEFRIRRHGEVRWMLARGKALRDGLGRPDRIIGVDIDITDRKRVEEELRRSEERFRKMAETVPDILFTSTATGIFDYVSPSFYAFTGRAPATPLDILEALHPDDCTRAMAARSCAERSGRAFECECRIRAADGSYGWFVMRWHPVVDDPGRTVRWFGAITDINALKEADSELRRTNERLERLLGQMKEYQYSLDREWRVIECNSVWAACAGSTPDQLIGRDLRQIMPNLAKTEMESQFHKALTGGKPASFEACSPQHPMQWQQLHVYPIPEGISVFGADISTRKTAELKVRAAQALLQSSLDALSTHVAILDKSGRILAVNAAWRSFAEANGFAAFDRIEGKDYLEICEEARPGCGQKRGIAAGLAAVMKGEQPEFRIEYPCHCSDQKQWFQFRVSSFGEGPERRLVVAHEGITEVKRAEEALRKLTGRILQVQDMERRRIARELHDSTAQHIVGAAINITRAVGLSANLSGTAMKALEESSGLLEQALREIRTMSYLLHPPMLDETGLASAIRWYAEGFSRRSGIEVDLTISPELNARRLTSDVETAFFRILQEALGNVHRHSGSSKVQVLFTTVADGQLLLSIEDKGAGGAGVSAESRRKLPRAQNVEPTGVGVAGMRERLTQLKGRLEFKTGREGTSVRAFVPLPKKRRPDSVQDAEHEKVPI